METRHGRVTTPALLPVVNPNRPIIPPTDLANRFHAEILITNAYILGRTSHRPPRTMRAGGLHPRGLRLRDRRRRSLARVLSLPRPRSGHHRVEERLGSVEARPSLRGGPPARVPTRRPPRMRSVRFRVVCEIRAGRPDAVLRWHSTRGGAPGERLPVSGVQRPSDERHFPGRSPPRGAQPPRLLRRNPRGASRDRARGFVGAGRTSRPGPPGPSGLPARTSASQRIPRGIRTGRPAWCSVLRGPGDRTSPDLAPVPAQALGAISVAAGEGTARAPRASPTVHGGVCPPACPRHGKRGRPRRRQVHLGSCSGRARSSLAHGAIGGARFAGTRSSRGRRRLLP